MFWDSNNDSPTLLQESINLNRFEELLRHLHFINNGNRNTDRLFKLRPLIDSLNKKIHEHSGVDENISIDESMIPYYGKHYAKQYIKEKPIRFRYKNLALCQSEGYMMAFEIYSGKSNEEKLFGLGGDVVLSFKLSELEENTGFKIYFDN